MWLWPDQMVAGGRFELPVEAASAAISGSLRAIALMSPAGSPGYPTRIGVNSLLSLRIFPATVNEKQEPLKYFKEPTAKSL
jgi:hypothetical protein